MINIQCSECDIEYDIASDKVNGNPKFCPFCKAKIDSEFFDSDIEELDF